MAQRIVKRGGCAETALRSKESGDGSFELKALCDNPNTNRYSRHPSPNSRLLYDGNMTEDQNGNKYIYNAWNQLVEVTNYAGTTEIAGYSYNGLGQEVTAYYPGSSLTKNLYYSTNNQVIEERDNGTANDDVQYQYVWSEKYVDAMVLTRPQERYQCLS